MKNKEFEQKSKQLDFLTKWLIILIGVVTLILFVVLFMIGFSGFYNNKKTLPQERILKPILDTQIISKPLYQEATQNTQIMELNKEKLLLSIMWVESNYNFEAIGGSGSSFGLFQVKEAFYRHHTKKENFEEYKFDKFKQIDLHLDLLNKYENLTIFEFAQTIQRPFNVQNWTDKIVKKYNSYD